VTVRNEPDQPVVAVEPDAGVVVTPDPDVAVEPPDPDCTEPADHPLACPAWPPLADRLVHDTTPGDPEGGCGHAPASAFGSCSVVVPLAVVTSAELTVCVLGHQAANHPFWSVACTWVPSASTSVAAVTPLPARPSANEYESPPGVRVCDAEASATWPADGDSGVLELFADTAVSDGPVMHEA
jgi:hypothetical protein